MLIKFILLFLSIFSPLIPIWTGRTNRYVLWWYACISLIFDLFFFTLKNFELEAYWAYNLFLLLEYLLVSYFFSQKIFGKRNQIIVKALVIFIGSFFVTDTFSKSISHFNYAGGALLYGIFILFAILGLYRVIKEIEQIRIGRSSLFFACIAFLFLASGSFIILLFEAKLIEVNKQIIRDLWAMFHNPLNILKNVLIGYALWLEGKTAAVAKRKITEFKDVQNATSSHV